MAGGERPDATALGLLLQRHRERRGLTQEQLAERAGAGLSVRTVSNLERGRTRPHAHTLAALATALGLSEAERADLLAARTGAATGPAPSAAASTPAREAAARPMVRIPTPTAPLVGRGREWRQLQACWQDAAAGQPQLALLTGEAGIGKTRLAEELGRQAATHGALVLIGRCYDLAETPPYGPWTDLFARYPRAADLPSPPPAFAQPDRLGQFTSPGALLLQIQDFLAAVADRQPLLLLLDDLQWADPASLDLLRSLARHGTSLPLLLLVTYRANELPPRHPLYSLLPTLVREAQALRLALRPLGRGAIGELVAARYALPRPDEARLVDYLDRRAEGNPFFIGELLHALEEEGTLDGGPEGWGLGDLADRGVPPLVRQVIEGRVRRLGEECHRLLTLAAVIGQEVPLALWGAVSQASEEGLDEVVERATEAHLMEQTPDGTRARFAHALIRETLYEGLLPSRRRAMHRRAAEALASMATPRVPDALPAWPGSADPDAVAYHLRQAGDPRAVEWLVRAGERAQGAYAWVTAAERFEAALALLEGGDTNAGERGWLLYRLARVRRYANPRQAIAYLEEAGQLAATAGDRALAAMSLSDAGMYRQFIGESSRGLADMAAGVEAFEALPAADRARLDSPGGLTSAPYARGRRATLAITLAHAGRYSEALEMGGRYLSQTSVPASGAERGASPDADAHCALGIARAMLGQPIEARHCLAWARAAYRAAEHHQAVGHAAVTELWVGLLPYAPERLAERHQLALEAEQAVGRARSAGIALPPDLARSPLLAVEGQWAEARAVATTVATSIALANWQQLARCLLASLAREQGEPGLAAAQVRAVLPAGPATPPGNAFFHYAVVLQRVAALLALDEGDLRAARAWLAAHDRWLDWSGAVLGRAEGELGWAAYHLAAGDVALARRHTEHVLTHASEPRQPFALLAAHRLLGDLDAHAGRHDEGAAHLDEALGLADACAAPYERALTLLVLAELHGAAGEPERARVLADEARTICAPLDARPALARAERLAAEPSRRTATRSASVRPAARVRGSRRWAGHRRG